jgi:HD superfamily phosphohydrolase
MYSNKTSRSTLCKICKDNGKSKNMYESHNVKNEKGMVCCPVLKAHICEKCGKNGHTKTYCTKSFTSEKNTTYIATKKEAKNNNIIQSIFQALQMDNDEDSEEEKEKEKEKEKVKTRKITFAELLSSYKEEEIVKEKVPIVRKNWADYTDSDSDSDEEPIHPNVTLRPHQKKW